MFSRLEGTRGSQRSRSLPWELLPAWLGEADGSCPQAGHGILLPRRHSGSGSPLADVKLLHSHTKSLAAAAAPGGEERPEPHHSGETQVKLNPRCKHRGDHWR